MNKLVVCIDFDGTIVEHKYPAIGKLLPLAKEVINKLHADGHYIIIWTCRSIYEEDIKPIEIFMHQKGIHYDAINENAPPSITGGFHPSPKVFAHIYIDDRGLGCPTDWLLIDQMIQKKIEEITK